MRILVSRYQRAKDEASRERHSEIVKSQMRRQKRGEDAKQTTAARAAPDEPRLECSALIPPKSRCRSGKTASHLSRLAQ